ncbi:probable pectinesterase 68 isoform X2 [Carya illinoinensis]|uniref:probable pectinesterase 68 isoform X2 n=1 Tax=Carya illinoinensis TaxID=32201 RepID=UPI001C72164D|nr:probable pectinesterase 68 isoform X2 [Carya illinoinensis]
MASLSNSFLFSFFFFVFSFLLCLSPLQVTSFHRRSLLSLMNGTVSTNVSTGHHHKWVGPIGCRVITVNGNGSADFRSVQKAVDSIPVNNTESVVIQISAGYYKEKVLVPVTKPYITFEGAGRDVTVIEWHDRACDRGANGQQLRTYRTASVTVFANYFSARNISFKKCELHSIATKFGSIAAQYRRTPYEKTGFAFVHCKVTGTGPLYVGRAMGQYARIVYSYTYFDNLVAHGGWDVDWETNTKNKTVFVGVYKCWGPGAEALRWISGAKELDYDSAHRFLVKSFVNGRHWIAPSDA